MVLARSVSLVRQMLSSSLKSFQPHLSPTKLSRQVHPQLPVVPLAIPPFRQSMTPGVFALPMEQLFATLQNVPENPV
jgi:hypothetical protein